MSTEQRYKAVGVNPEGARNFVIRKPGNSIDAKPDLVCFSHLRWDFVYQRPQHLLTRCAKDRRVFFIEEPKFGSGSMRLEVRECQGGVHVVVPHLPAGLESEVAVAAVLKDMVQRFFLDNGIRDFVAWYYTPMALSFTDHLKPIAYIYDCMDELSAFKGADARLQQYEKALFGRAHLVFTGGHTLYEAKKDQHRAVYAFPSSIDRVHFAKARGKQPDPVDQKAIPHPRLGFFGVIDERFDIELLDSAAVARPDWQFVMIGPVVKIDPSALPLRPNIHYLGPKSYEEWPAYLSGWDVALLLFARNEATRFISPTKTPEYLAAGRPVISTSITDVVRPYGEQGLVDIADTAEELIAAAERVLAPDYDHTQWLQRVDSFLAGTSWDQTWSEMSALIDNVVEARRPKSHAAKAMPAAKGPATVSMNIS